MRKLMDWFHWIPRLLCIMAILFVSMFALDSFEPGISLWEQVRNFLIHLIPSYVLLLALWVAWKKEKWGGILFIVIGALTSIPVFQLNYQRTDSVWVALGIVLIINIPFILVGTLFLISDHLKKQ